MTIHGFVVGTHLHPGISEGPRESVFPATQAGLALARDTADVRRVENRGSYGNVGCGSTQIYCRVEGNTDPGFYVDIALGDIPREELKELPIGSLTLRNWEHLDTTAWDGNNHVRVNPYRSKRLWAKLQFKHKES